LVAMIPDINNKIILKKLKLNENGYVLVTLHRPSNVDDIKRLNMVINKIAEWSDGMEIIWPVHPRVDRKRLIIDNNKWRLIEPIGYIEFLKLMKESFCVFTDSGGIQEETSFLGIPCFTLRNNTERPITCQMGTNKIITEAMINKITIDDIKSIVSKTKSEVDIPLWDGQSANRIKDCFIDYIKHNEC